MSFDYHYRQQQYFEMLPSFIACHPLPSLPTTALLELSQRYCFISIFVLHAMRIRSYIRPEMVNFRLRPLLRRLFERLLLLLRDLRFSQDFLHLNNERFRVLIQIRSWKGRRTSMPLCPTIRGHLHLIRRKKEGRVLTICRLSEGANMLDRVEARPDFISALFVLALIRSIFTVQSCLYEQIVMEISIRRTLSLFRPILSISSYWLRYSLEQSFVLNEPR